MKFIMLKKKKCLHKIIFFTIFVTLVIAAVIAPSIPLRIVEAILLIIVTFLFDLWYQKKVQLKVLRREYLKKNELLNDIFKNAPDLIFYKDVNSKYLGCNKAFAELYGLDVKKVVGKSDFDLAPNNAKEIIQHDIKVVKTQKVEIYEQTITHKAGNERTYHIVKSPLFNSVDKIYGILVIAKDVTEIKEIQNQKETLVATLTHDLKVPTMAQIKALELLSNGGFGEIPPPQKEIIKNIYNSCKYMSNMIATVLSTYKYENNQKTLLITNFDFTELIIEVCNELNYLGEERNIVLEYRPASEIQMIDGDKADLKRVLLNLLSNSISYSLKNSKIIIRTSIDENKFKFTAENASSYISKKELEILFSKFFTGYAKFRQVGTGLGLYLSKQIISAHNGSIILESNDKTGNIFGFEIDTSADLSKEIVQI